MRKFFAQPYKLFNKIQHYDWGTKDDDAYIPHFIGTTPEPGVPYAELWIGAHPKAPSEIEVDGKLIPLDEVIAEHSLECLGKYVSEKFGRKFPFLLKVLSAARALSIQTHPGLGQAKHLHASDPQNYPDDNHKPEVAIAVDSLIAVAGFRPAAETIKFLHSFPEILNFAGGNAAEDIFKLVEKTGMEKSIAQLYGTIMKKAGETKDLQTCIESIRQRLIGRENLSIEESQFLNQYNIFGVDVGLLSFFFFNFIQLKPHQAIFTEAGVPHAYIKGNVIECMANSDNVVRAGLTNKFKDVDTLLMVLRYEFKEYEIFNYELKDDRICYKTPAEEFEVSYIKKEAGSYEEIKSKDGPEVYLVFDGGLEISWEMDGRTTSQKFLKGESFLIPAFLPGYEISSGEGVSFYKVEVPNIYSDISKR